MGVVKRAVEVRSCGPVAVGGGECAMETCAVAGSSFVVPYIPFVRVIYTSKDGSTTAVLVDILIVLRPDIENNEP